MEAGAELSTIKNWWGMGFGFVGLYLESMFLDGLFGSSRSWLSLAEVVPAGPAKPQPSKYQDIEN